EADDPVDPHLLAVLGADEPRPRAERLVGLAPVLTAVVDPGVLVEPRGERDVEAAVRIAHPPRLHRAVPVVGPLQFVAELGEPAGDDEPVLGEPSALGPLGAELQADEAPVLPSAASTPVPADLPGPAAAPDVERRPPVDGPGLIPDDELAGRRTQP